MSGKLEKYPSKIDPILKTLINKCLEKDEVARLSAREMIYFQDDLEIDYFGEVISTELIKESQERY
jgi:hypothetical protein